MVALIGDADLRRALQRAALERSPKLFVEAAWPLLEPGAFVPGWHIDAICEHLEAVSDSEIRGLVINVPPRSMKSTLVSVIWPVWIWAQDPDPGDEGHGLSVRPGTWRGPGVRFLTASYAEKLAMRDSMRSRRIITSTWYQDLWGSGRHGIHRVVLTKDQNTKARYDNMAGGARIATSTGGLITGEGGDIFVVDDPHNAMEAESPVVLEKRLRWFDQAASTRLNDPAGAFVVVMQRLHDRDLTGHILAKDLGWDHLCLPMRYEDDHPHPVRSSIGFIDPRAPSVPAERRKPALLWPERLDEAAVEELEKRLGPYAAAGQLQQRPAPREGGLFKREWFRIVPAAPASGLVVRAWDLAATAEVKGSNPSWTVGVRMRKCSDGAYYIEDIVRLRGSPHEVERAIVATASQDGRGVQIRLPQDPGQAGKGQARYLAQALAGYDVRFVPPTGSKETRAMPLAAQAEVGNVRLVGGTRSGTAAWIGPFLDEISLFPLGTHSDQVDAAADAFDQLTRQASSFIQVTSYGSRYTKSR